MLKHSSVAYVALPLVLHILDVNLSTTPVQIAQKQGRLNIYMQAMKGLQSQYDGTDEVWNFIKSVVEYASIVSLGQLQPPQEPPRLPHRDGSASKLIDSIGSFSSRALVPATDASDWGRMLLKNPTLYLRLTHTIDLCLSRGRYPEDSDFPLLLKSTYTHIPLYQVNPRNARDECYSYQDADKANDSQYQQDMSTSIVNQQDLKDVSLPTFDYSRNLEVPIANGDFGHDDLEIPISSDDFVFDFERM
jgi:hypothetical protein